jgi:hypothetical protein
LGYLLKEKGKECAASKYRGVACVCSPKIFERKKKKRKRKASIS